MTMELIELDKCIAEEVRPNDIVEFETEDEEGEKYTEILHVEVTGADGTRVLLTGISEFNYGLRITHELNPDLKVKVLGYE